MVKDMPKVKFVSDERKVAIPSGMLCAMMANMEKMPTLYSFLSETLLFSGTNLSINDDSTRPIIINILRL